jgi:seryl-tRNA synthetase
LVSESYKKQLRLLKTNLKLKCAQYRIDFVEADIDKGYQQVLMPYLIKREKMI